MPTSIPPHPALAGLRNSIMGTFSALVLIVISVRFLDEPVLLYLAGLEPGRLHQAAELLVLYLNPWTIGVGVILLPGWYIFHTYNTGKSLENLLHERTVLHSAGILIALFLTLLLKVSLGRARPELLLQEGISGFFGYQTERLFHSLPSAHITSVAATATAIALQNRRIFIIIACIAVVLLTGLSRLLTLDHHPADLIAGIWAGVLMVYWAELLWLTGPEPQD